MNDRDSLPLDGVRVVDLTDGFGAYAGRLLAGLGAEVIWIRSRNADEPLLAPTATIGGRDISLFDEWVGAGKRPWPEGTGEPAGVISTADVVLTGADGPPPGTWENEHPELVHVAMTPFGWGMAPDWSPVDDLLVLGRGGLLHLGGYPDTGPIGAFGNQSMVASGIFGAVAALVGLLEREQSGKGGTADVSAQEAVAHALEDSLPTFALTGAVREPQGEEAREAGTGIYACKDGYVSMVAGRLGTARAWSALTEWLASHGDAGAELLEERWDKFSYRQTPEASGRFREIFEEFAGSRSKADLYVEGQQRGIPISPVSDVGDLLVNEQLNARHFFVEPDYPAVGGKVRSPGSPFRMSGFESPILDGLEKPPAPETDLKS